MLTDVDKRIGISLGMQGRRFEAIEEHPNAVAVFVNNLHTTGMLRFKSYC